MNIQSLWRYPVKSLLGEPLSEAEFEDRGVVGDRSFALVTDEGKLSSGKHTRRFTRVDGLLSLRAVSTPNSVSVEFPDGESVEGPSVRLNEKLSATLGQELKLAKEDDISHFDAGPVHILTTSSLSQLQSIAGTTQIDIRRFRPNLVLQTTEDISDDALLRRQLKIGKVVLEIIEKTERCRMISLAQEELAADSKLLKTMAESFGLTFGVYAKVLHPGRVTTGQMAELQ